MVEGEKGIDYCPYCESDLIRNVGDNYGCNSCDNIWEMKINKEEKCRLCGEVTEVGFNIKLKRVLVCENCANAITKQQVNSLTA